VIDQEELEMLRWEVAQLREMCAVAAERARLSGQVIDPPDALLQALGLRVAQAPLWQMGGLGRWWWQADLGCGLTALVCPSEMGCGYTAVVHRHYSEDGAGTYAWRLASHGDSVHAEGESATAKIAMADVLRAAERIGVALVSQARVGLKALEENT